MKNLFNHLKITTLDNKIVRFEYCPNDEFSDQESLNIKNKKSNNEELDFKGWKEIRFEYNGFTFLFNEKDPLNSLVVQKNSIVVYKFKNIKNSGVLPTPNKTPEVFALLDSPRLLIPLQGYEKNNDGFIKQKDVKDLYLLLCEKDHELLRRQYISLTGTNELQRLKSFGLFLMKNSNNNQEALTKLIQEYETHKIPLDNIVIDSQWKNENNSYNVNETLFPNIDTFFMFAHRHNLQVMMNDQPHKLNKANCLFDNEEIEYKQSNLTKMLNKGLDGWWIDENKPNSKSCCQNANNYIYNDIENHFFSGFVLDPAVRERNLTISNLNISFNSRNHQEGIKRNNGSLANEQCLRNEIINLNNASNNMISYYSADVGGHESMPNKNQLIRWVQFGAFSPIMRPYPGPNCEKQKELWNTNEITENLCKTFINTRYRLLNNIYTSAYKNVESGLGICSALSMYYPLDKKAVKEETSYMFGNSILVAPICGTEKPKEFKKKDFINNLKLTIFPNGEFDESTSYVEDVESITKINKFFNKVKLENKKAKKFSLRYRGEFSFDHEVEIAIKHLTPVRIIVNKKVLLDTFGKNSQNFDEILKLKKNRKYQFTLETVQHRRLQPVELIQYRIFKNNRPKVYLPEGEWFNVYHRNVYQGKRYLTERFKIDEMPIFVKAGSLLAMYKKIDNISKMSLKQIVYDYYTSKKEDIHDYFYEDDGKTMGYTIGEYRKNYYHTYFNNDRYIIELTGSEKILDDEIKTRDAFFKVHVRDNETIKQVLINGNPIKFKRHDHRKSAIPFLDNEFARDSKTLTFKFKQIIKENYKIELIIE